AFHGRARDDFRRLGPWPRRWSWRWLWRWLRPRFRRTSRRRRLRPLARASASPQGASASWLGRRFELGRQGPLLKLERLLVHSANSRTRRSGSFVLEPRERCVTSVTARTGWTPHLARSCGDDPPAPTQEKQDGTS